MKPKVHESKSDKRVCLMPVRQEDLPVLFEFQSDPESNRLAKMHPRSRSEFDAHWSQILRNPDVIVRSIQVNESLAGCINFFRDEDRGFVGYWVGRKHWGHGIATEALRLLLTEATTRPLFAHVAVSNPASIRVLEKCGFEIVERQHSLGTERLVACEELVLKLAARKT